MLSVLNLSAQDLADMVIFSFDRPLQLYALLESVDKYMTSVGEIVVVYRASNENFSNAYELVHKTFDKVAFLKQGSNPKKDFQSLTLHATFDTANEYVIFAVDDIVVKDFVDLSECIKYLKKTKAYGFYLRLGKNITYCYMQRCAQSVPPLNQVSADVFSWRFSQASRDWGYPNTVDMTVYCKKSIHFALTSRGYSNPNLLETYWAFQAGSVRNRLGLCYQNSKVVNLPLNRVQTVWAGNRNMNLYTPQELLDVFNDNKKIDIDDLFQVNNKGPHMEYEPRFVDKFSS